MNMKGFNMIVFMFCCVLLNITTCFSEDMRFSQSSSNMLIYKRLPNISIRSCSSKCSSRRRCKQAIYNRAAKVCSLTQSTEILQFVKKDVLLTGFAEHHMVGPSCGGIVCSENESCELEDSGYVCKVQECDKVVSSPYYKVYGNIYDVHNTLYVVYYNTVFTTPVTITCADEGRWLGETFEGCCYIGCVSGVVQWPGFMIDYYCDMDTDTGHWVVFQRRQDGSEDFFRGWVDYVNGFGDLLGEFWLGLENIHRILTTDDFELRVDMASFEGERRYADYNSFSINGAADKYRLTAGGYSGDGGNALGGHSGYMFSTVDNDNDNTTANCADRYKGAWWYTKCHAANLNGLYYHSGANTTIYAKHVHWARWLGYWHSLKFCEMKFRRLP